MKSCLIVTSDKPVRDAIRVGLEQMGTFDVRGADVDLARDLLEAHGYDLVVVDQQLGDGSDGMEFLRETRGRLPDAELALITHGKATRVPPRDREALNLSVVFRAPIATAEFFGAVARMMDRFAVSSTTAG